MNLNMNERLKSNSLDDLCNKLRDRGLNSSIQSILVDHIARNFSEQDLKSLMDELKKLFLW